MKRKANDSHDCMGSSSTEDYTKTPLWLSRLQKGEKVFARINVIVKTFQMATVIEIHDATNVLRIKWDSTGTISAIHRIPELFQRVFTANNDQLNFLSQSQPKRSSPEDTSKVREEIIENIIRRANDEKENKNDARGSELGQTLQSLYQRTSCSGKKRTKSISTETLHCGESSPLDKCERDEGAGDAENNNHGDNDNGGNDRYHANDYRLGTDIKSNNEHAGVNDSNNSDDDVIIIYPSPRYPKHQSSPAIIRTLVKKAESVSAQIMSTAGVKREIVGRVGIDSLYIYEASKENENLNVDAGNTETKSIHKEDDISSEREKEAQREIEIEEDSKGFNVGHKDEEIECEQTEGEKVKCAAILVENPTSLLTSCIPKNVTSPQMTSTLSE